jgi:preprotein translocase subunit Sss1
MQEIMDVPREFVKDGSEFRDHEHQVPSPGFQFDDELTRCATAVQFVNRSQKPDSKEFIKIAQAVGVGFLVMGVRFISTLGEPCLFSRGQLYVLYNIANHVLLDLGCWLCRQA